MLGIKLPRNAMLILKIQWNEKMKWRRTSMQAYIDILEAVDKTK